MQEGCPEHPIFEKEIGLCVNLNMYEEHFIESDVYQYDDELEQQFRDAGLDARWPFDGDFERYSEGDIWANQDRLNWVEKMATSS